MAYETGSASDPADLLTKLITFASANGWTVNTPTSGKVFVNGQVVVGVKDQADTLDARGAITYAAGSAWDAQTNNSGVTHQCDIGAGPYTAYHFYATVELSKPLLAVILEKSAGIFRHFILTDLIKYGTYTGGVFTDSVNWADNAGNANQPDGNAHRVIADTNPSNNPHGHVWIDYDAKTNNWQPLTVANSSIDVDECAGSVRLNGISNELVVKGFCRFNERVIGVPIELFANRSSSLRSIIGRVPNMRAINILSFSPGELVTIGTDTWQVFPIVARTATWGSGSTTPSSGPYGYAYKR